MCLELTRNERRWLAPRFRKRLVLRCRSNSLKNGSRKLNKLKDLNKCIYFLKGDEHFSLRWERKDKTKFGRRRDLKTKRNETTTKNKKNSQWRNEKKKSVESWVRDSDRAPRTPTGVPWLKQIDTLPPFLPYSPFFNFFSKGNKVDGERTVLLLLLLFSCFFFFFSMTRLDLTLVFGPPVHLTAAAAADHCNRLSPVWTGKTSRQDALTNEPVCLYQNYFQFTEFIVKATPLSLPHLHNTTSLLLLLLLRVVYGPTVCGLLRVPFIRAALNNQKPTRVVSVCRSIDRKRTSGDTYTHIKFNVSSSSS